MSTLQNAIDIDSPYSLTSEQIAHFRDKGCIKLKNVLSPETLAHYGEEISRQVKLLNRETRPMEERDTYSKAFLQVTNIWTKSDKVREFSFGKRLARIATELLGVTGVRMYHDQALYKEPSGGFTPWHADQYYWPLSNMNTVTAWIPLQATPMDMGPLAFCEESYKHDFGRDLNISDESETRIQKALADANLDMEESSFDLGEVSFHYGWTFHRAGPNTSDKPREVMTIIYMDEDMHLAEPRNPHQKNDWNAWCPDVKVGELIDSKLNPVIYSTKA